MSQVYTSFAQAQQALIDVEAIDYFFAKEMIIALAEHSLATDEQQKTLMHLFMALSVSLRAGHSCLPLAEIASTHWAIGYDEQGLCSHQGYTFPSQQSLSVLLNSLEIDANSQQPLVLSNNNLYMRRYFQFESQLAQNIHERLQQTSFIPLTEIVATISQLFPQQSSTVNDQNEIDWQKLAVANAINKNFTVIAGGPGTGKTYTVTKLLAALLMLQQKADTNCDEETLDIALVAPTGKAAQRLSESIIKAIAGFKGLINDEILAAMPTEAKTIHRLLGVIPNSPNFRFNQDNQLSCDVLLIDEVSMVDLPMMARIFRALKAQTKVILLGDADQLPSVAVGSILADIAPRPHCGYSDENLGYLAQACQIEQSTIQAHFSQNHINDKTHHDHLSFLMKSRRFDGEGGIGKLATYVIQGQAKQSWQLLSSLTSTEPNQLSLVSNSLVSNNLYEWLAPLVKKYYQGIAQSADVAQAFEKLAKFRVLCVTRQGEFGVDTLNQWIKAQLNQHSGTYYSNSIPAGYHGMPIMISENDYRLGLFNGDIGLLWRTDDGHLMAYFESSTEQNYKILLPSRLPKYGSVYAMTIHKTQGSEFDHVAIALPQQSGHQLLSRELLYTGITRAKTKLTIASNSSTWQQAVKTATKRYSGLAL